MHVAFGSPGQKGVTHLMAVGDYVVGEPVGPLGAITDEILQPKTLLLMLAAGVAGYMFGKRSR